MNIYTELQKEHSKEQALKIANYACSSDNHFAELMHCFLLNEYRTPQRAAWSVSWAAIKKPEMINPYIKDLVAQLSRKDVHPAVIRNSVRVLEKINIPEMYHADVMNACFSFIEDATTPGAIKAFSLTTLHNLSNIYPDIKSELKLIIESKFGNEKPAFQSRARKILKKL